ncbi:hypothetical protein [Lolliginicoccus suaedae]|uniref:hypothetical protein n=1 Tax=Lolliginicoccus suaedae TaxID=2605429 RepID=UPI0011EFDD51|nr:hypothetical protein [Lolliginicoccus suaedae]
MMTIHEICQGCARGVERLDEAYQGMFPRRFIAAVLGGCVHDLAGTPAEDVAELSERLAHYRLDDARVNHRTEASWLRQIAEPCPLMLRGVVPESEDCLLRPHR